MLLLTAGLLFIVVLILITLWQVQKKGAVGMIMKRPAETKSASVESIKSSPATGQTPFLDEEEKEM